MLDMATTSAFVLYPFNAESVILAGSIIILESKFRPASMQKLVLSRA
jgi:hypothetical protein